MTQKDSMDCIYHQKNQLCTSSIRLFRGLPEEIQKTLVERAAHTSFQKGTTIVREGTEISSILIVRRGLIKTYRIDASGEEHVLDVLHEGQAIWHGMFLKDHIYHYSVGALSDVSLCMISRTDFEAVLADHPSAAMGLIEMLSTELDDAEEKALLLGIRNPRKRLAGFLLHRDERCIGEVIHLKLEDIAGSVSLRPETVSRNLSAFEKEHLIARHGQGKIEVINRRGLQKIFNH